MERITADVMLVEGTGTTARAHLRTDTSPEPVRVSAALISEGTGYAVTELAGRRVIALVDGRGDLSGFERA
jgi:hypothetical protein